MPGRCQLDLAKLITDAGAADKPMTVEEWGVSQKQTNSTPNASARAFRPSVKHPQHANHIGYAIQVKYRQGDGNWFWCEGDNAYDSYSYELAVVALKEKQLDWPNHEYRIVGVVEVS